MERISFPADQLKGPSGCLGWQVCKSEKPTHTHTGVSHSTTRTLCSEKGTHSFLFTQTKRGELYGKKWIGVKSFFQSQKRADGEGHGGMDGWMDGWMEEGEHARR